jgi:hypothetical protein
MAASAEPEKVRYATAASAGDTTIAVVFAGEGIDLIGSVEPAGAVLEGIVADAEAALARRFD